MEKENVEIIQTLKLNEKKEIIFDGLNIIVTNKNSKLEFYPKPSWIFKISIFIICCITIFLLALFVMIFILGIKQTIGIPVLILSLLITNSVSIEILKVMRRQKLAEFKKNYSKCFVYTKCNYRKF